jgi:hypothetical protein
MSLPVWQALHEEISPLGVDVVTVALDVNPDHATPWIDMAKPTHPSLIDTSHVTAELYGFQNVPMAVWIDEHGMFVRAPELASIEARVTIELPDATPERIKQMMAQVNNFPDVGVAYRAAIVDWAHKGAASEFVLSPDEVLERSQGRTEDHARAAAFFEIGQHLLKTEGQEAAVPFWREAHRLFPDNWSYKRQAWTLVTTPADAPANDLMQGPNDVYDGNWLDDLVAQGGHDSYYPRVFDASA